MKQQKLDQLAKIISRLEEIIETSKPLNSQPSLFRLFPTFQPDEQTSSITEQSINQIFEDQPTQDLTQNYMKRFSTESDFKMIQLDFPKISLQLKEYLQGYFRNLSIDSVQQISELIQRIKSSDNSHIVLIQNQLYLINSVIETHTICKNFLRKIQNIQISDKEQSLIDIVQQRNEFQKLINKHKIDSRIFGNDIMNSFMLIKEQQLIIQQTEQFIEDQLQKCF